MPRAKITEWAVEKHDKAMRNIRGKREVVLRKCGRCGESRPEKEFLLRGCFKRYGPSCHECRAARSRPAVTSIEVELLEIPGYELPTSAYQRLVLKAALRIANPGSIVNGRELHEAVEKIDGSSFIRVKSAVQSMRRENRWPFQYERQYRGGNDHIWKARNAERLLALAARER